jgi:ubiquinone/menaquinone biosynthesis C-methylase UbiE
MNLSPEQRREMDRHYHDVIGSEYDQVILDPRQTASDLLFSGLSSNLPQTGHMLDIGCGTGQAICRFGAAPARFESITAVDHSSGMMASARGNVERAGLSNVDFVQADVIEWLDKAEPESFDLITAIGFLHHLDDDQVRQVVARMSHCLKPAGKVLIADPLDPEDRPEPPIIQRWNRKSLAVQTGYTEEPEEPDERPLPQSLMNEAFETAGLRILKHASSWEIFNHSTHPGLLERLKIRFLYHWGGPGIVNAWLLEVETRADRSSK